VPATWGSHLTQNPEQQEYVFYTFSILFLYSGLSDRSMRQSDAVQGEPQCTLDIRGRN
jgi:hypothetical protein